MSSVYERIKWVSGELFWSFFTGKLSHQVFSAYLAQLDGAPEPSSQQHPLRTEKQYKLQMVNEVVFLFCFVLFFFDCACGMWKFLDQGLNPHHSSSPSCCSDNAGSLVHCATGNSKLSKVVFVIFILQ